MEIEKDLKDYILKGGKIDGDSSFNFGRIR